MEISRILRVLITLIFVVTFITLTIGAYRQDSEINSMATLSDATTSIANNLASQGLVWVDDENVSHPLILDSDKLEDIRFGRVIAGENFAFRASISYWRDNSEREIGPYGKDPPEDEMTCSFSLPVALHKDSIPPAKLKVVAWFV